MIFGKKTIFNAKSTNTNLTQTYQIYIEGSNIELEPKFLKIVPIHISLYVRHSRWRFRSRFFIPSNQTFPEASQSQQTL